MDFGRLGFIHFFIVLVPLPSSFTFLLSLELPWCLNGSGFPGWGAFSASDAYGSSNSSKEMGWDAVNIRVAIVILCNMIIVISTTFKYMYIIVFIYTYTCFGSLGLTCSTPAPKNIDLEEKLPNKMIPRNGICILVGRIFHFGFKLTVEKHRWGMVGKVDTVVCCLIV